jgi:ribosomal protein S27E
MAKTDEAKTKKPDMKSASKPDNNGGFEVAVNRSFGKGKIPERGTGFGKGLSSWVRCANCDKNMVYDGKSQAMLYCKTCDRFGVD